MRYDILFFKLTFLFYTVAILHNFIFAFLRKQKTVRVGYFLIVMGFILHSASLVSRFLLSGYMPFTNLYESLVFFSWTLIVIYMIFSFKYRIEVLGVFILPLVFFSLLYAGFLPNDINPLMPALRSHWLEFHVTISFFGYATFALAFSTGLMYLIQEHYVKMKRPAPFYYLLPSLDMLDEVNYRLISIGFPLFTASIILGAFWANQVWGSYWSWDPKETWALVTWFIYVAYLHSRHTYGWRGRRAAYLSVIGFLAIVFTYLGVNFFNLGLHAYTAGKAINHLWMK